MDNPAGSNEIQGSLRVPDAPKNVFRYHFYMLRPCVGTVRFLFLWLWIGGKTLSPNQKTNIFLAQLSISIGNNLRLSISEKCVEGKRDRKRWRESFKRSRALRVNKAMGCEFKSDRDEKLTTDKRPRRGNFSPMSAKPPGGRWPFALIWSGNHVQYRNQFLALTLVDKKKLIPHQPQYQPQWLLVHIIKQEQWSCQEKHFPPCICISVSYDWP